MEKNNFSFFYNYLNKINVEIDIQEFEMQVFSHPDFPSILAFSDTIKFLGVENEVFKVSKNEIIELEKYFIAVLRNDNEKSSSFFTFVERTNGKYVYFDFKTNSNKIVDEEEFIDLFQEIVLLVKPSINGSNSKNLIKSNKIFNKSIFNLLLLSSISAFSIIYFRKDYIHIWYVLSILVMSLIGIFLSYEALLEEIGILSKNIKKFCDNNGENSCKKVITSNNFVSNYVSISKSSFTFFTFQFLYLLISNLDNLGLGNYYVLTMFHFASFPIVCISFFYQRFIIKEYCKICLLISCVLLIQICFSSYFIYIQNTINLKEIGVLTLIILFIAMILSFLYGDLFDEYLRSKMKILSDGIINLRIRKNVTLFKLALKNSRRIASEINDKTSLSFESNSNSLDILLVISPTCGHCKEAIELLHKLWKKSNKTFNLRLHFNVDLNKSNYELLEIHLLLTNIFLTNSEDYFIKCILNWYVDRDVFKLRESDIYKRDIDLIYSLLNNQFQWNYSNNIFNTPKIIINGYEYPEYYDRKDLGFYISDLLESFE